MPADDKFNIVIDSNALHEGVNRVAWNAIYPADAHRLESFENLITESAAQWYPFPVLQMIVQATN